MTIFIWLLSFDIVFFLALDEEWDYRLGRWWWPPVLINCIANIFYHLNGLSTPISHLTMVCDLMDFFWKTQLRVSVTSFINNIRLYWKFFSVHFWFVFHFASLHLRHDFVKCLWREPTFSQYSQNVPSTTLSSFSLMTGLLHLSSRVHNASHGLVDWVVGCET